MQVKDLIISKFSGSDAGFCVCLCVGGGWVVFVCVCVCLNIILIGQDHLNYGIMHYPYYFYHYYSL